jgi:hypothetical protein
MVKILTLVMVVFLFSGCGVLKAMTAPFRATPGTVPQSKIEAKAIVKCTGELSISKDGVITCSKGYYSYNTDSNVQERKLTIVERIKGFVNNLMGISFWLVLALIFLCPSLLGLIAGRLFEGVYGIGSKALRQVSAAIQKVKDTTPSLVTALEASTDENVKVFIDNFKKQNGIK